MGVDVTAMTIGPVGIQIVGVEPIEAVKYGAATEWLLVRVPAAATHRQRVGVGHRTVESIGTECWWRTGSLSEPESIGSQIIRVGGQTEHGEATQRFPVTDAEDHAGGYFAVVVAHWDRTGRR